MQDARLTWRISYRNPVMLLGDGMLGQIMEPVQMPERPQGSAACQALGRRWSAESQPQRAIINSLYIDPAACEQHNTRSQTPNDKVIEEKEVRWQNIDTEDADVIVVGLRHHGPYRCIACGEGRARKSSA